jgi:hypothetical protein
VQLAAQVRERDFGDAESLSERAQGLGPDEFVELETMEGDAFDGHGGGG